jgi:hypothetical protein
MGYNQFGYVPRTADQLISSLISRINEYFGTSYTTQSFIGTNFYKLCYAVVQLIVETETDTGEIYAKLQDYFRATNETLINVKPPRQGMMDEAKKITQFNNYPNGIDVSFKNYPQDDPASAGKLSMCADVDTNDSQIDNIRQALVDMLANCMAEGVVTEGNVSEEHLFSNGQIKTYKFTWVERTPIKLKLTGLINPGSINIHPTDDYIKNQLYDNINERYIIGSDFAPQNYFTYDDAPYLSELLLQYSLDSGASWNSDVVHLDFYQKYTFSINDILIKVD